MSNTYRPDGKLWELDSTGTLWTNTLGSVPSSTIGPKWVTRIIMHPNAVDDDLVFQDVANSTTLLKLEADSISTGAITVDFSAENGGKGRRWHSCKISTLDTSVTAELFVA